MTSGPNAPPLPPPQLPAAAACAVSEAARAAADAWAQPMDPAEFGRAVSQLHSVLRDLGIAARGLARYQTAGYPADPAPLGFSRLIAASAERLLRAWENLDGVVAAEGLGPVPDPDEPGAVLCRAARSAITAWRQPAGSSAERDTTVERLITAVRRLSAATQCLITYAPRRHTIELRAVETALTEATARLARAIQRPASIPAPRLRRGGTEDGDRLCPQSTSGNPAAVSRYGRCASAIQFCRTVCGRTRTVRSTALSGSPTRPSRPIRSSTGTAEIKQGENRDDQQE
jgi:hypothetical protein